MLQPIALARWGFQRRHSARINLINFACGLSIRKIKPSIPTDGIEGSSARLVNTSPSRSNAVLLFRAFALAALGGLVRFLAALVSFCALGCLLCRLGGFRRASSGLTERRHAQRNRQRRAEQQSQKFSHNTLSFNEV